MKKFKTQEIRDLFNRVMNEEISFSRMVEMINEMVSEAEKLCVEDIPKRKFKEGDKVRIKEGVSSKTYETKMPWFNKYMDELIGTTMTVSGYTHENGYVVCNESGWRFNEEWLEPVEELKEGDLAIFWDENEEYARAGIYAGKINTYHYDHTDIGWANAIKFESKEQYERLIKGEI